MAKRILLDIHSEPTWYTLLGVSCHLQDYRLSFLLNKKLEIHFSRLEDVFLFPQQSKDPAQFPLFYFRDEDQFNSYFLITNRTSESVLIPSLKQADFILIVEGPFKDRQKEEILDSIRSIPNVLTAFEISFSSVKNLEGLLTDLELHMMNLNKPKRKQQLSIKTKEVLWPKK